MDTVEWTVFSKTYVWLFISTLKKAIYDIILLCKCIWQSAQEQNFVLLLR